MQIDYHTLSSHRSWMRYYCSKYATCFYILSLPIGSRECGAGRMAQRLGGLTVLSEDPTSVTRAYSGQLTTTCNFISKKSVLFGHLQIHTHKYMCTHTQSHIHRLTHTIKIISGNLKTLLLLSDN